ncbi:MAG: transcription antitermination factor NusB [Candidatus Puniceispirillales bacterium WSBS_2018_MAG_OTU23]
MIAEADEVEKHRPKSVRRRTACRIAAVQTLFQAWASKKTVADVVPSFQKHFLPSLMAEFRITTIDDDHYTKLVFGAAHYADEIDQTIIPLLRSDWTIDRLGEVERSVIRAAFIEFRDAEQIPAKAIITEYTAIADSCGGDGNFVNAILDKLARLIRPDQMTKT